MSNFMVPEVYEGSMWVVEDVWGQSFSFPADMFSKKEARNYVSHARSTESMSGIFVRLSAPGYMDCTEWDGPFTTEEEALEHLKETYDLEDEEDELTIDA